MTTRIYRIADKATNKPRLVRASHPSVAELLALFRWLGLFEHLACPGVPEPVHLVFQGLSDTHAEERVERGLWRRGWSATGALWFLFHGRKSSAFYV